MIFPLKFFQKIEKNLLNFKTKFSIHEARLSKKITLHRNFLSGSLDSLFQKIQYDCKFKL